MLLCSLFALAPCCCSIIHLHRSACVYNASPTRFLGSSIVNDRSSPPDVNRPSRSSTITSNCNDLRSFARASCFVLHGSSTRSTHIDSIDASRKASPVGKNNGNRKGNKPKQETNYNAVTSGPGFDHNSNRRNKRSFNQGRRTTDDRGYPQSRGPYNDKGGYGNTNMSFKNNSKPSFDRPFFKGAKHDGEDRWLTKPISDAPKADKASDDGYVRPNMYGSAYIHPKRYGVKGDNIRQDEFSKSSGYGRNDRGYSPPSGGYRGNKSKGKQWNVPTHEDLTAQVSKFNRKLAQENQKIMRATTERMNPLLNLVAHSNQKKKKLHLSIEAQQKIKALTKGGLGSVKGDNAKNASTVKKDIRNLKSLPNHTREKNAVLKNKNSAQSGDKVTGSPKDDYYSDAPDISMHSKNLNLSTAELNMMPVDVPGIRRLGLGRGKGDMGFRTANQGQTPATQSLQDKLLQLRTVGFDGIVDMNSLFDVTSSVFQDSGSLNKGESTTTGFSSLGITNRGLVRALGKKGILTATSTQAKYIPTLTSFFANNLHRDDPLKYISIHAPTGSGKTLAYILPLLQRVLSVETPSVRGPSGNFVDKNELLRYLGSLFSENIVVLAPSVELSVQSHMVLKEVYHAYESVTGGDAATAITGDRKVTPSSGGTMNLFKSIGAKILGNITHRQGECSPSIVGDNEYPNGRNDMLAATTPQEDGVVTNTTSTSDKPLKFKVAATIKPILLIGNANVTYQKRALKELKAQQAAMRKKAIDAVNKLYSSGPLPAAGDASPLPELQRIVGVMFTTPGRAFSLWKTHRSLDLEGTKYCVVDEYDGFLQLKRIRDPDTGMEREEVENSQVKAVLDAMLVKPRRGSVSTLGGGSGGSGIADHTAKYVVCLSASKIKNVPACFGRIANVAVNSEESGETGLNSTADDGGTSPDTDYETPKNILHGMCLYSVADAKLALLRKVLCAFPYDKSALVFCDTTGTAEFLESYLSNKFPGTDVTVLNCRQGKLERKKSFQSVLQSNLDTALRGLGKASKGSSTPVRNIVISTQLNSRGIDFSGFSHVIHYDLPHDVTTYLHRSGRIGRAGNPGICISLVESRHLPIFQRVICRRLPADVHNLEVFKGYLCRRRLRPLEQSSTT